MTKTNHPPGLNPRWTDRNVAVRSGMSIKPSWHVTPSKDLLLRHEGGLGWQDLAHTRCPGPSRRPRPAADRAGTTPRSHGGHYLGPGGAPSSIEARKRPARPPPCLAAKDTQRHQLLGGRQGAMVAVEARLGRVDIPLDDSHLAVRHRHHIADPLANLVADPRAVDAGRDRFVAGPDPHPITHDRSPGVDHVPGCAGSRSQVAGASLSC